MIFFLMEEIFGISQSLPIILKLHRNGDMFLKIVTYRFSVLFFK